MENLHKLAAVLFVATATSRVDAHHSFAAEFDPDQPVLLRGVITKVEFMNPHS